MKIPTARVERSVFFCVIFQFVGKLGGRTLFAPAWGLGFYPLVLATKKYVM